MRHAVHLRHDAAAAAAVVAAAAASAESQGFTLQAAELLCLQLIMDSLCFQQL
jgi:hypothetical protein